MLSSKTVVAAAGRRIDAADATATRFPLANVAPTRERVRRALADCGAVALVSSAACGADLIALTEAGDLHADCRVILPFEPARFKEQSVVDRPGEWGETFDRVVAQLQAAGKVIVLGLPVDDNAYIATNEAILDEAERVARETESSLAALVIWDGQARPGTDLTRQFRDSAERRGFRIVEVLTGPASR